MLYTWNVQPGTHHQRVDQFLAERLPTISRSQIAKWLKQDAGVVNGKPAKVHTFVSEGDQVKFTTDPEHPEAAPVIPPPPLQIVDATVDWIVINKPSGVLVHPDTHQRSGTLVDALLAYDPAIAKIGENPERPGIVHRLDKEASGLMVVARTPQAFDHLKCQFAQHQIEKKYLALVHGTVREDEGEIKFRIAHSKTRQRMAAHPVHEEEGKAAWTHFKTLQRFRRATLLELEIFSGRTHQIRAHLFAYGHPLVGDSLYPSKAGGRLIHSPRLLLQSIHLGFRDPENEEWHRFDLNPDPEFHEALKQLSS